MPPALNEDVRKKFGLESAPASVQRLTQLIARRDATTEDFAALVSQDKALSARLLRVANPRATCEEDYVATTVEEALQRTGMSIVLLLAMSDPLERAVLKTFQTMVGIELKSVPPNELVPLQTEHVVGELTFAGKATGLVNLRLPSAAVPIIGNRLLGLTASEFADAAVANDVIGELCNMIVGNFKSNLCDAGLQCKLSPPKISRTANFIHHVVKGGTSERLAFQSTEFNFFADVSVDPWND